METIRLAGELAVPFTTGILIGIGETRAERIESLLAIRDLHAAHGHIQEVIVQNFRAKPGTKMAGAAEPDLDDLLWSIAVARLILPDDVHVQAPPNLSPGVYPRLIAAGIDDWGGVSPVTPDHVNPEAPWPAIVALTAGSAAAGKMLVPRLPVYPAFAFARRPLGGAVAGRRGAAGDRFRRVARARTTGRPAARWRPRCRRRAWPRPIRADGGGGARGGRDAAGRGGDRAAVRGARCGLCARDRARLTSCAGRLAAKPCAMS